MSKMNGEKRPSTLVVGFDYGNKVTKATLVYPDGGSKKGQAKAVNGDKYVPEIGAVIAMCKAFGSGLMDVCEGVVKAVTAGAARREQKSHKVTKVKVTREAVGRPCGIIRSGKVRLHLDGALAELAPEIRSMGTMGELTMFKDRDGKDLRVGDLVMVDKLTGTVRQGRKWTAVPGFHFVVCEDSDDERSKGAYIMGMLDACNPDTGKIDKRFRVRRAKTWKEVELGEVFDHVKPVWEGVNNE